MPPIQLRVPLALAAVATLAACTPSLNWRDLRLVSSPLKLEKTPVRTDLPPPLLGQHTDAVLRELLGCDDARLAALRAQGAIG